MLIYVKGNTEWVMEEGDDKCLPQPYDQLQKWKSVIFNDYYSIFCYEHIVMCMYLSIYECKSNIFVFLSHSLL
jgi:hypothetical protein